MSKLPKRKNGDKVIIKDRKTSYSFWPMYRTTRRPGVQLNVFTVNPWGILERKCNEIQNIPSKNEALACLSQAKYFFEAGETAHLVAAKPLMFYYSFLNLVKTYGLLLDAKPTYSNVRHGINNPVGWIDIDNFNFKIFKSPDDRGNFNLAIEFIHLLDNTIPVNTDLSIFSGALLAQIVTVNRIWGEICETYDRFVSIEEIDFIENKTSKSTWLRIKIFDDDLKRLNYISHTTFLTNTRLGSNYHEVKSFRKNNRKLLVFEQVNPIQYTQRVADKLLELSLPLKKYLWVIVRSIPPYRKYYLYNCPSSEINSILPQEASLYSLMYLLSSITRYSPEKFEDILRGKFGALLSEFISSCPRQFLYLMTSNALKQEISMPAIVY